MPAKNILKTYVANGFYHLYNRGVEKRDIFLDEEDYKVFLNSLKQYLLPKETFLKELTNFSSLAADEKDQLLFLISSQNNFSGKIELLTYVLMPNHFHFLLRQREERAIESFMRSHLTKYVSYFNQKYDRLGPLFQGRYKGILIEKEKYFLHLSRYIHLNPLEILPKGKRLLDYPWSSYPAYVNGWSVEWLKKDYLLSFFKMTRGFGFDSYQGFVEGYQDTEIDKQLYHHYFLDF